MSGYGKPTLKQTKSWQLLSYVHSVVYMEIQWDSGGGAKVADLRWWTLGQTYVGKVVNNQ